MTSEEIIPALLAVAPVRERGLKYTDADIRYLGHNGRSREGAWIEIIDVILMVTLYLRRSREGAWIEIDGYVIDNQIRVSRSREGAWIEILKKASKSWRWFKSLP